MTRCGHQKYWTVFLASVSLSTYVSAQQVVVQVPDAYEQKMNGIMQLVKQSALLQFEAAQLKQREERLFTSRLYSQYNEIRLDRLDKEKEMQKIQSRFDEAIDAVRAMAPQNNARQIIEQQSEKSSTVMQRIAHGMWQRKLAAVLTIMVTVLAKPLFAAITAHMF